MQFAPKTEISVTLPDEVCYALVMGIQVWLSGDYDVCWNCEAGNGHCDLTLKTKKDRHGIIVRIQKRVPLIWKHSESGIS